MMRGRCQVSGFGGQEEACDELPSAGSGPELVEGSRVVESKTAVRGHDVLFLTKVKPFRGENNRSRTPDKGHSREKAYETHSAIDSVSRFFKAWR
jgi:hypothetical protein